MQNLHPLTGTGALSGAATIEQKSQAEHIVASIDQLNSLLIDTLVMQRTQLDRAFGHSPEAALSENKQGSCNPGQLGLIQELMSKANLLVQEAFSNQLKINKII